MTRFVNTGVGLLADALRAQGADVTEVDWQPPMPGTEADLATVAGDPRRAEANAVALRRVNAVRAELVDVVPASEAVGLQRGEFLHAGPPIEWTTTRDRQCKYCILEPSSRLTPLSEGI